MTDRVVSYSEYDALRMCPLKHHLAYNRRWRMPDTSRALSIGSLFHEVMEAHYSGEPTTRVIDESEAKEEYRDTVEWMYAGYQECYGDDDNWKVIEVEKQFELPLGPNLRIKGRIDLLVQDRATDDGLWVVDHKSCRELPKGKALEFDDQFGLYVWLLRNSGIDVRGVIHNACRTHQLKREMRMDERFRRTHTIRQDRELDTIAREARQTFERGLIPWVGQPPRATDPDRCGWRCDFTEACLMARKGPDIEPLLEDMDAYRDETRH